MKKNLLALSLVIGMSLLVGCVSTPGGRGFFVHPATVSTNASGVVSTNVAPNYVVNPGVANSLGTAQDAVSAVPFPWSGAVTTGLGVLSALLALVAKIKSDRAAILPAIIAGVEAAGNVDVKKAIKTEAIAQGVQVRLHREVKEITG